MPELRSARTAGTARVTIRPWVAEAIESTNDERLSADRLSSLARQAITAWEQAVAGGAEPLAAMTSQSIAHWLLHPPRKGWQVAPEPAVTEIVIRHLDTGDQPALGVHFRFAGRKQFDDRVDDETLFAGDFGLVLADADA